MSTFTLNVQTRTEFGKEVSGRLRREGKLPVVLYGHKETPVTFSVDAKEFGDLIHKHGTKSMLVLEGDGRGETAFIKSIQRHHMRNVPQTIDLIRVSRNEKITVKVALLAHGDHLSVKSGEGVLVQSLHDIEITAPASRVPDAIHFDISNLELDGPAMHVKDLTLPSGVELITDGEEAVAAINFPATVEQEGGDVIVEGAEEVADATAEVPAEHGGPVGGGEGLEKGSARVGGGQEDSQ